MSDPLDTLPVNPGGSDKDIRPRSGGTLGRYALLNVLGQGAMATVFRARDSRLGREVAIKVMSLVMASRADSNERFRREAHAVAAVKHPFIVEIFDFVAATAEDPAYIVSELIDGPTLRKFLDDRRGRLLPEAAALLTLPLAEALGVAHERGIVHRDLKPDNVMIDSAGTGAGRVVLTDFGIAHVTGMETMTATGAIVGSPAYMSPEQARGQDITHAADLWAFGAMLYELLTGAVPFPGKDPLTVIAGIARGQYRKPSQLSAAVGADIERIVVRCLKNEPAERYPNAAALAQDLRAVIAHANLGEPTVALHRFLQDPDAFDAELRPRIAAQAVANARKLVRRAEMGKAISEIGRATAYVPGLAEAERLLQSIAARRTWFKLLLTLALGVAVTGLAFAAWKVQLKKTTTSPAPFVRAATNPEPAPPPVPPPPAPAIPTPVAAPLPVLPLKAVTSRRKVLAHITPAPAANLPVVIDEGSIAHPVPVAAPALPDKPVAPSDLAVKLTAGSGWCYPGLDMKPGSDTEVLADMRPGKTYPIYCARDPLAPKDRVGPHLARPTANRPRADLVQHHTTGPPRRARPPAPGSASASSKTLTVIYSPETSPANIPENCRHGCNA